MRRIRPGSVMNETTRMSERQRGQADEKELGVLGHVFLALSPPLARPLGHRGRRA